MMRVLDLFSGIGGFSLGLERTGGFRTVAFCEIEPFPRAVLAKLWPEVPCYDDVRSLTGERLAADGIAVDVVCGGFPCQGISAAGRGAGLDDPRSGLWSEYARIVGEVGPRWVIVENSPNLRTRGADRVLEDLEAHDYACRPFVVGAAHAGAPHRRARVFILAHANAAERRALHCLRGRVEGKHSVLPGAEVASGFGPSGAEQEVLAHRDGLRQPQQSGSKREQRGRLGDGGSAWIFADPHRPGLEVEFDGEAGQCSPALGTRPWPSESGLDRMAHGVPHRAHRVAALGNAVCPPLVEAIGRAILAVEHQIAAPRGHEAPDRGQDVSSLTLVGGVTSASGPFGSSSCCTSAVSVNPGLNNPDCDGVGACRLRNGGRGCTP